MRNCLPVILILPLLYTGYVLVDAKDRNILVFGGNGFLGSEAVEKFITNGDHVTMVNRGNWYWDSKNRIVPYVKHVYCDRQKPMEQCTDLVELISQTEKFDAVIDFSGYGRREVNESLNYLRDRTELYVLISTDSVYDVCAKTHKEPTKETDAVRPKDPEERELHRHYHFYGHGKLEVEEEILAQRLDGGFPFIILRLPDVLGPRDSTYRFWMYQLWLQLAAVLPNPRPVTIPHFLEAYPLSFVYSVDVGDLLVRLVGHAGPQVLDQAINLGYPETRTLQELLLDIQGAMGMEDEDDVILQQDSSDTAHQYFYPSVRKGPVDVSKAQSLVDWKPTPWHQMIKDTVAFYEAAMRDDSYNTQRDEIIQVMGAQVFKADTSGQGLADIDDMYDALEKIYDINLHHFKPIKDEL